MEKVLFALDVKDEWPPVGVEGMWCEVSGNKYKLCNAPFFLAGIASGDVFTAVPDPVNGLVFDFTIVKESGHSVAWFTNYKAIDISSFKAGLLDLGCKIEGFPQYSVFSIDVPRRLRLNEFDRLVDDMEKKGVIFAFPTWRHDD